MYNDLPYEFIIQGVVMQKYDTIESGIENNDIKALREAIGSICYTSRDFSSGEFDEVVSYVEAKGIKIKDDSLTGNPTISSQKDSYNDEDFAKAIFELKRNFCDERIQDVKHIGKVLYPSKTQPSVISTKSDNDLGNLGKNPNEQSHQPKSNTSMIVGLVAIMVIIVVGFILLKR